MKLVDVDPIIATPCYAPISYYIKSYTAGYEEVIQMLKDAPAVTDINIVYKNKAGGLQTEFYSPDLKLERPKETQSHVTDSPWIPVEKLDARNLPKKYDKVLATVNVYSMDGTSHRELRLCYYRSLHWWFDCATDKPVDVVAFIKAPQIYKEDSHD